MKLIRLNSFLYLFCILSAFASCVQKTDNSVEFMMILEILFFFWLI